MTPSKKPNGLARNTSTTRRLWDREMIARTPGASSDSSIFKNGRVIGATRLRNDSPKKGEPKR